MTNDKLLTPNFLKLTVSNLLMAVAFYFITPIMSIFMVDMFQSKSNEVGLVMFAFSVAAILSRPFTGFLLDSLNRYRVYIVSFVFFLLAFMGYPIALSFAFLLLLRFYHGLAWGAVSTASNTIAVDLISERRRGEGIGIFGLSMTVAMAIGPAVAIMLSMRLGYNALFYTATAFCILGFILVLFIKMPENNNSRRGFNIKTLISRPTLPIANNVLLTQIPYGGIVTFAALYGRHVGVGNSGIFFIVLSIGILASRVISGRVFDRIGPKYVMITGIMMVVVGLVVIGWFSSPFGFHVSALILGVGFGIISPTFQAMANAKVIARDRGAVNSTYLTFFDSGVGLGMLLFGVMFDMIGYAYTFYISALIQVIALILFLNVTYPKYKIQIGRNE